MTMEALAMQSRRRFQVHEVSTILVVLLLLGVSRGLSQPIDCVSVDPRPMAFFESIGLVYPDPETRSPVVKAVEMWKRCKNYGVAFPPFLVGEEGSRTFRVEVVSNGRGRQCGSLIGNRILIHRWALSPSGRPTPCGSSEIVLAHELGHVLGLGDQKGREKCNLHIMAQTSPENERRKIVRPSECEAVGAYWRDPVDEGEGGTAVP